MALADDDSPGVVRLYESSMLKNNRSAGTGDDRAGDPTADDGLVDANTSSNSLFVSGSGSSDRFSCSELGAENFLATANIANAASPPAAAIVIPDSLTDSIMQT